MKTLHPVGRSVVYTIFLTGMVEIELAVERLKFLETSRPHRKNLSSGQATKYRTANAAAAPTQLASEKLIPTFARTVTLRWKRPTNRPVSTNTGQLTLRKSCASESSPPSLKLRTLPLKASKPVGTCTCLESKLECPADFWKCW